MRIQVKGKSRSYDGTRRIRSHARMVQQSPAFAAAYSYITPGIGNRKVNRESWPIVASRFKLVLYVSSYRLLSAVSKSDANLKRQPELPQQ